MVLCPPGYRKAHDNQRSFKVQEAIQQVLKTRPRSQFVGSQSLNWHGNRNSNKKLRILSKNSKTTATGRASVLQSKRHVALDFHGQADSTICAMVKTLHGGFYKVLVVVLLSFANGA